MIVLLGKYNDAYNFRCCTPMHAAASRGAAAAVPVDGYALSPELTTSCGTTLKSCLEDWPF